MSCGDCTNCSNACVEHCTVCINCNANCNTQQSFCTGSKQKGQLASAYIGAAGFPSFQRNDIIFQKFPRTMLNEMIDYVTKAAKYGSESDSGSWTTSHETRSFIYADKINELLNGISSLSGQSAGSQVAPNDVIYADFFSNISKTINELKLSTGACNSCVSECNVQCNTCDGCDVCEKCDDCEKCDSCQGVSSYSSHYSSYYASAPATEEE
jgi:hypothetical protein